jgi:hypothetical protein
MCRYLKVKKLKYLSVRLFFYMGVTITSQEQELTSVTCV